MENSILQQMVNDSTDYMMVSQSNFELPNMADMYKDNISTDFLKKIEKDLGMSKIDGTGALFFTEDPYAMAGGSNLGYYPNKKVFLIKSTPIVKGYKNATAEQKEEAIIASDRNEYDGDTVYFATEDIKDGGMPFTIEGTNTKFTGFKQYIKANSPGAKGTFGIRLVGIDAPEITHYSIIPLKDNVEIKEFKFKDILVANSEFIWDKSKKRQPNDKAKFIRLENSKYSPWYECVDDNYIYKTDKAKSLLNNGKQKYAKIVFSSEQNPDQTEKNLQGIKAKEALEDLLKDALDLVIMVDCKTINRSTGSVNDPFYKDDFYRSAFNVLRKPFKLIKDFLSVSFGEDEYRKYYFGYNYFGQDTYRRFLGALYVKKMINGLKTPIWINVNKYMIANFPYVKVNPDISGNPMTNQNYNYNADAFKLWTYNLKDKEIVDEIKRVTQGNLDDRNDIQKQILGKDFSLFKDYTVMIGDCLLMVPPTSIRIITQSVNEKAPLLRARGSMIKSSQKSERIIELTLYFNNDEGINGIPHKVKLPNGKTTTYHMNGLRSLISMFKFTPFLPIESNYINNTLNIEAVTLANIQISTVDGYPKLIAASLTLQEFNYRIYMPEIPKSDNLEDNLFSRMIDFKLMRYYYQRAIQKGELLKKMSFNSEDYITETFGNKTGLQPMYFTDPNVEFYVVDKEYLDQQLKIKTEAMSRPMQQLPVVSATAEKFAKALGAIYDKVSEIASYKPLKFAIASGLPESLKTQYKKRIEDAGYNVVKTVDTTTDFVVVNNDYKASYNSSEYLNFINLGLKNKGGKVLDGINDINNAVQWNENISSDFRSHIREFYNLIDKLYSNEDKNYSLHAKSINTIQNPLEKAFWFIMDAIFDDKKIATSNLSGTSLYKDAPGNGEWVDGKKLLSGYLNPLFRHLRDALIGDAPLVRGIQIAETTESFKDYGIVKWWLKFNLEKDNITEAEILNLMRNLQNKLGISDVNSFYKDGMFAISMSAKFTSVDKGKPYDNSKFSFDMDNEGMKVLSLCAANYGTGNDYDIPLNDMQDYMSESKQATDVETTNSLKFVRYPIGDVKIKNISAVFGNNITRMSLQAYDGYAPQYIGGQDTIIEVSISTKDENAALLLNQLPKLAAQYARDYRLVLNCWPLRINSEITRLLGVNEVIIESVDSSTVPGQPGLFVVNMRLMSVDRTLRNRESLKKLDVASNAGSRALNSNERTSQKGYFDLKNSLAKAELYPDLELPTIQELEIDGFKFVKYATVSSAREFPDPDFYFAYGHLLGNEIFKSAVLRFFDEQLISENNGNVEFLLSDQYGADFLIKPVSGSDKAFNYEPANSIARDSTNKKESISDAVNKIITENNNKTKTNNLMPYSDLVKSLYQADMYQTWDISENIRVGFREKKFEKDVYINKTTMSEEEIKQEEQRSFYVNKIKPEAKKAIDIIDKIINSPMSHITKSYRDQIKNKLSNNVYQRSLTETLNQRTIIQSDINRAISDVFNSKNSGESIFSYLQIEKNNNKKVKDSIMKMVYSSACALSGQKQFGEGDEWQVDLFCPRGDSTNNNLVPICIIDGSKKNLFNRCQAENIDDAVEYGIEFGIFKIKKYTKKEIQTLLNKVIKIDNKDKGYFIDPYYGGYEKAIKEEELKLYKELILIDPYTASMAFIRNMLFWMKKMLEDNILISLLDVIEDEAIQEITKNMANDTKENSIIMLQYSGLSQKEIAEKLVTRLENHESYPIPIEKLMSDANDAISKLGDRSIDRWNFVKRVDAVYDKYKNRTEEEKIRDKEINKALKAQMDETQTMAINFKKILEDNKVPMAIGKFFAPIVLTVTGCDTAIYELMTTRNYDVLNDLITTVNNAQSVALINQSSVATFKRFVLACVGSKLIKSTQQLGVKNTNISEFVDNYIAEKMYISAADNPATFMQHSFYDMITNDKRGRMLRAFPTFYMMFIDEGREIGLWHLHDNFYNTSAISEIQVTKSRKIAPDTATVVMSNMFKSYTTDDEDTKEVYGYDWKDAWNSIFSPRTYYIQEEYRRSQAMPIDRIRLQPGVRLHIKMGYSSDASTLPTIFNGVVSEVGAGEAVQIIAQGDGVELINPILTDYDAEDIQNQDTFILGRMFKNWITKGATPRQILCSLLTTKGGWLKGVIRSLTDGRFFNQNPYGIIHFGDPEYTTIFRGGECVQNIYEGASKPSFGSNGISEQWSLNDAPKLSTHIFGKSYWDIMNICASASVDYVASIVPFGLRSSIFFGHPRFYYAYDYEQRVTEGGQTTVKEKRKPFQQYHIYTSYSDIIGNSIKASDRDVKTCAVGLWSSSGFATTATTEKVGPMWVDFDIYPEKQKTMVYDTQLLAKGTAFGDIIPFVNWIQNQLADPEGVIQGGYQLAWRMTASALKNSIKDMYQGELIVIGDPTVKPHDRMWIHDIYENMQGSCLVEAVVHNFNAQDGYTTSVYADCIATIDDRFEKVISAWGNSAIAAAVTAYTSTLLITGWYAQSARPLLKSLLSSTKGAAKFVGNLQSDLAKLIGKEELYNNEKFLSGIDNYAAKMGFSVSELRYDKLINSLDSWQSILGKYNQSAINLDDLSKEYSKISKMIKGIDPEDLLKSLADQKEIATKAGKTKDIKKIQEAIDVLNDHKKVVQDTIKSMKFDANDFKKLAEILTESKNDDAIKMAKKLGSMNKITKVDDIDDIAKAMKMVGSNTKDIEQFADKTKDIYKMIKESSKIADSAKKIKGASKIITNGVKTLGSAIAASGGLVLLGFALEFAVTWAITKFSYEFIERWMQNLQVLQVFPLKKNGRVLTAGLDGSKGLVVGSPTENQQGLIETWVADLFHADPDDTAKQVLLGLFASEEMLQIAEKYRTSNVIESTSFDPLNSTANDKIIQQLLEYSAASEIEKQDAFRAAALVPRLTMDQIKDNKDTEALMAFSRFAVTNTKNITLNADIRENMVPVHLINKIQDLMKNDNFIIIHNIDSLYKFKEVDNSYYSQKMTFRLKDNDVQLPVIFDNGILDIPVLRTDATLLLLKIIDKLIEKFEIPSAKIGDKNLFNKHKIILHSALRAKENKWTCTGFCFRLQVTEYNKFGNILKELYNEQVQTSISKKEFFSYKKISEDTYDLFVCPPKVNI